MERKVARNHFNPSFAGFLTWPGFLLPLIRNDLTKILLVR
jgi:hypothetical protein